jgi:dTDP-glucose 4,6-dehydratase
MSKRTWLVTGIYGFIGSNFARMLVDKGEEVIGVDLNSYAADSRNIEGLDIEVFEFCISNYDKMDNLLEMYKPDIVVNFAAESHVDRSIEDSMPFIQSNIVGVAVILDLALKHDFRLVQVSTDEVYGSVEQQGEPFTEEMTLMPNSPYSASKASADLLLESYVHTHKINASITRCSNNYGPYQHPEKMLPKCIINSLTGKDIPLYGDGLNVRDWIHVADHCEGIYLVGVQGKSGAIYNFGGSNQLTNKQLVEYVLEAAGGKPEQVKMVEDRKGHDRTYAVNFEWAESELGWLPRKTWTKGFDETVSWYKENQEWWKGKT